MHTYPSIALGLVETSYNIERPLIIESHRVKKVSPGDLENPLVHQKKFERTVEFL